MKKNYNLINFFYVYASGVVTGSLLMLSVFKIVENNNTNIGKVAREEEIAVKVESSPELVSNATLPIDSQEAIASPAPLSGVTQTANPSLGLTSRSINSEKYTVHKLPTSNSGTLLKYIDRSEAGQQIVSSSTVYSTPTLGTIKTALTKDGWEYQVDPLPNQTVLNGQRVLERMPVSWYGVGEALVYTPQSGEFLLPAPLGKTPSGTSHRTNVAELEKLGYKVIGQFGASFKSFSPEQGSISLRYFWHYSQGVDPKVGQSAPNIIQAGMVKYKDGRIEYLDFCEHSGKGSTASERLEDVKRNVMRPALEALQKDDNVEYFVIDTHCVIRKQQDIPNIVIRGGYTRGGPFLDHQRGFFARSVRVFDDKTKQYLGSMITPSMYMRDVTSLAKEFFGSDAVVQHLDGDAFAAAYFTQSVDIPGVPSRLHRNHHIKESVGQEFIVKK
ncbi:MAG: hypothetical protein VKJ27_02155 [Synechocystis sp.]|nr:hypothetical protein [Synechocystis sp.]